jgi:hypothetical protein
MMATTPPPTRCHPLRRFLVTSLRMLMIIVPAAERRAGL